MSQKRINIAVVGGTKAELTRLSDAIGLSEALIGFILIKTKASFLNLINKGQCHLIIGNSNCKGFNIFDAANLIADIYIYIPTIGVYDSAEFSVVEAMQKGLADYVELSNYQHLKLVVNRELQHLDRSVTISNIVGKDFTGLFSRLQFLEFVEKNLPQKLSNSTDCALFYLQLDNFSWINESNGLLAGDIFLKNTAIIIANLLKTTEVAARYQGGSFVLLIEADGISKLTAKADMIRAAIADAVSDFDDNSISSTCSIGMYVITDSSQSLQDMISNAFNASEIAKSNGGDGVNIFRQISNITSDDKEDNAWNDRILEAFENDLFLLFFQPIVSLKADTKPRYEVLLRMIDEDSVLISPGTFLPYAERAGLMADIDRRVIRHALQKAVAEKKMGNEIEIFIKLSGKSLDDKKMPSWIRKTLKEIDFPRQNIVFEITESLALTHLSQTRNLVNKLKTLKCKIALDHFGKRLKSFNLLEQIEVDYIKIDGSLVQHLAANKAHQSIVKKIISAVKNKNIQVIAESVQEAGSLPIIWKYGIHFVQGYFLQIPDNEMDYDFSSTLL